MQLKKKVIVGSKCLAISPVYTHVADGMTDVFYFYMQGFLAIVTQRPERGVDSRMPEEPGFIFDMTAGRSQVLMKIKI